MKAVIHVPSGKHCSIKNSILIRMTDTGYRLFNPALISAAPVAGLAGA